MNTYKISYKWDKESFIKASKEAYDYEFKNSTKRYIGWLFVGLAQFGVVALLKNGAPGLLYISTFLILYWYVLRWKLRELILKKSFKSEPNSKVEVIANDDFLKINNQKISWDKLDSIVKLDNGYILRGEGKFLYFPKSATNSDFIQFIKSKLNEKK